MKESDLFPYIKQYLLSGGYKVRAEVNGCYITAVLDDNLIIIEMKLRLNLELIMQAVDRQRITDSVYVAIPTPDKKLQKQRLKGIIRILKRLEIGLIIVDTKSSLPVKIIFHPKKWQQRKQLQRKRAVLKEISLRKTNLNIGGTSRKKIFTAYRENAIEIAVYLQILGESSAATLQKYGTCKNTHSILYKNYYKWFTRKGRGKYILNNLGILEIQQWKDLSENFKDKFKQLNIEK